MYCTGEHVLKCYENNLLYRLILFKKLVNLYFRKKFTSIHDQ